MTTEQDIRDAGAGVAPRVTPAAIEANISSEHYFTAAQGDQKAKYDAAFTSGFVTAAQAAPTPEALRFLTLCILVLRNGYTVVGTSACASPGNFNADVGRKIARLDAINKVWPLMGYALREWAHGLGTTSAERVPPSQEEQVPAGDSDGDSVPVLQQASSRQSKAWVPLEEYQRSRSQFLPSKHSARWQIRQHRQALVDAGAVALICGRTLVNPEAFDSVLQMAGKANAHARLLPDAAV